MKHQSYLSLPAFGDVFHSLLLAHVTLETDSTITQQTNVLFIGQFNVPRYEE